MRIVAEMYGGEVMDGVKGWVEYREIGEGRRAW